MTEEFINPIKPCGEGECPHCGYPLSVAAAEMTYSVLDKHGMPIGQDYEKSYYRCEGVCLNCGQRFEMVKAGDEFRIANRTMNIIAKYEAKKRADAMKHKDGPLAIYNNPFVANHEKKG